MTKALIQPSGRIDLFARRTVVATLVPGIFEEGWKGGIFLPTGDPMTAQAGRFQGVLRTPGGGTVEVSCRCTIVPGVIELEYHFRPQTVMRLNSLHVSLDIPASELAGQDFETDSEKGKTPTQLAENYILINKPVGKLSLNTRRAGRLELSFPSPTHVLFQDNRKWGPSFSIRMGGTQRPDVPVRPETVFKVVFALRIPADMVIEYDGPITITPGEEWIPLDYDPEIEPGTALDFSKMGFQEPPAGRYGRLLVNPDGFFAFEKQPKKPQRFYGVNLCFSAQYLRDEDAERLAERLARMGYNAVRLHHHDDMLVHGERGAPSPSSIRTETSPVRREFIPSLETPPDQGDAYGQRLRGYVHPPATGEYVFSIASDDGSELWLSTDDSPWKKRPVAWVDGWTGYRQFDKYPTQSSRPIQLESGRSYYMEVLHKEGFGGDHLSVAWKGPGVEGIIDGKHLSPWGGGHRGSILREVWNDPVPPLRQTSTIPLSEEFERLDRLIAALKRRGIYVSTDLYVSRRVKAAEIWPGVEGDLSPDDFKMAVPVNERAFTNWKTFANAFLTHRNPHTGLTYAEDPTLAWL
ncbi:MAG: PA14 domain-containing protein, partial [Kiritimatiellae bacterium]|nr:PA14 domain-containing protein [Kiritimatiellia bacterium]